MYPDPIEHFFAPNTIAEVVRLLDEHPNAKLIAGGQSLLPLMKARMLCPPTLIDINHVGDLGTIEANGDKLRIGALVRYRDVLRHPTLGSLFAALEDAAAYIGDRQVRNRGTVIGNLAQGEHTADMAPIALIFDAVLDSTRHDSAQKTESFAQNLIVDQARSAGFIHHIELRNGTPGSAFIKYARVAQDRAIVNAAAAMRCDPEGRCTQVRVAIGGILPTAVRVTAVESELESNAVDEALLVHLGDVAAAALLSQDDLLAAAAYRTQLIRTSVPAVIRKAIERAGGKIQ